MATTISLPVLRSDVLSLDTADLTEIYAETQWPRPFLRELLYPRDVVFQTTAVQLSYHRFRRALAPFVSRYQPGRILPSPPKTAQLIELPAFGPTRKIAGDDALNPPVQGVWISRDSVDYISQLVSQNWTEMELSHSTREEWLIANLLSTGIIDIAGDEGGAFKIEFQINPPITCTVGGDPPAWNTADVDLVQWLQDQARVLAAKCGFRPDVLVMGADAARVFMANSAVMTERNLRSHIADTAPEYEDSAVTYIGKFAGIDVYEYDGIYLAGDAQGNDVAVDMIAPDVAILASSRASGSMVYGAISVVEDNGVAIYAARRVPHNWPDKDNAIWTQRVSSRYCPAPADTGTWQTFSVIDSTTPPGA